jgi:hypothetical protein
VELTLSTSCDGEHTLLHKTELTKREREDMNNKKEQQMIVTSKSYFYFYFSRRSGMLLR